MPAIALARVGRRATLRHPVSLPVRRRPGAATALANVRANDLEGRVDCVEAAGFDHPALAEGVPYDLIFANILKGPLLALAPELSGALAPGGEAILSGILVEQADDVIAVSEQILRALWALRARALRRRAVAHEIGER